MEIKLSNRIRLIQPSPTLGIATKAKEMQAQGISVINFGVGEPDFNTPDYIKEAGKNAIDANFTRYTPNAGIPELRKAICQKFEKDNKLVYQPKNILVSPGAKASILNILIALCDVGDQVIIPVPYWVSYPAQVELANGEPLYLQTEEQDDFKIDPLKLEALLKKSPNAKVMILNSPSNPTGSVYSRSELEKIAEICLRYHVFVISDEIYEKLVYDDQVHFSIAAVSPEMQEMTAVVNGVSKAYAMTGWRLGYTAGPEKVVAAAGRVQEHATSCVNSITQKAVLTALTEDDGSVERMRHEFSKRRLFLREELCKIPHITCTNPKGAFYLMPNVSWYLQNNLLNIRNTDELSTYMLDEFHVALVAGSSFGDDRFMRFSYANSMENLQEGVKRFANGLQNMI
ncbi:MAG TPA: pyridoxal phosphate-dependent aminotransferase [Candidatus Cloacimonadota bacterium]|nr:pyridoxal phosphate-dependent aminotransferase [Candidatus Cloacimonadota bacterium]HPT70666.1 pyridoxal phosphate-dependent aminotransferase [Candidatus Cloacimonadota bacterium]